MSTGSNSNLAIYQNGTGGGRRLLMQETWGYSILDLSNPVNPTALYYHDVRYPVGGPNSVTQSGDGFTGIITVAVSADGQRAALSVAGPAEPFQTVVGSPDGGTGFTLWGDFPPSRAGTLIQHIGGRYIAYNFHPFGNVNAADVTTLPTDSLQVNNLAASAEYTAFPPGGLAVLAGNFVIYQSFGVIHIIDASNPGPVGSITALYPTTTLTSADFGGRAPQYFTAAVDPADPTKLWVLVELTPLAGQSAPTYSLVSLAKGFAAPPLSAGPPIQLLQNASPGDRFSSVGYASALIPSNGQLFVFMWAAKRLPTTSEFRLYSTTVAEWTRGAPNSFIVPGSGLALPKTMAGFGGAGNSVYAYVPSTQTAWVIPMSCGTSTTSYTPPPPPPTSPPTPPSTPPPVSYSCPTGASLGLPACNNGCYVAQPGPSGRSTADIWKCVPNGSFTQLLKLGSSGSEVVALQKFLNTAGYDVGTVDGSFGPKTQAAVIKFQITNGLVGDGIVGALTRAVLNK